MGGGVVADTILTKMVGSNYFIPVEECVSVDPCKLISLASHGQLYLCLDLLKVSCILQIETQ